MFRRIVYLLRNPDINRSLPYAAIERMPCFMRNISFTTLSRCKCIKLAHPRNLSSDVQQEHVTSVSDDSLKDSWIYHSSTFTYRTHTCGELTSAHVGCHVVLCGWVHFLRLSKFLLLRDAYGITQCVIYNNEIDIQNLNLETVVQISGIVNLRPKDMINVNMATGEIEVQISKLNVLNTVQHLPFNIRDYQKPKEQLRLHHRYLDLRFPEMQSNLRLRSHMLHNMRKFLVEDHNFVEVETPTLFCRTPGGAREFIVPTRHHGLFYSLVQSPQQFKQMLMSGGIDRYFQIARCYRDETTRPDRQPEFTQLDMELSFTDVNSILFLIEQLLYKTFPKQLPVPPFNKMTYKYALENYGTDKPNPRLGLQFKNLQHLFPEEKNNHEFGAYAVPYTKKLGKITTKYKQLIKDISKKYKTKIVLHENIEKEFGSSRSFEILNFIEQEKNSCIVAIGDNKNSCLSLGEVRDILITLLKSQNFISSNESIEALWVVDFPLFVEGLKGFETCHHPFTAPQPEDLDLLDSKPLEVRSLAYDLVMNGMEVGGGSVRVHNAELQKKILRLLNINSEKLNHFLNALQSGCPPHAGIALGIDRLMSIACNTESIRDVIAFPKSHDGKDPLSGAPNFITEDDKEYYHITIT